MSLSTVIADVARNRLRLRVSGRLQWKEAREFAEQCRLEAARLSAGFGVVADSSALEHVADDGARSELRWVHLHLSLEGARRVVHVPGSSGAANAFVAAAPMRGLDLALARTLAEAERLLDAPDQADPQITFSHP